MADVISPLDGNKFVYQVLRYTSDLVRDEWVNIGVILFDPLTGALRLRLVEEQKESTRMTWMPSLSGCTRSTLLHGAKSLVLVLQVAGR